MGGMLSRRQPRKHVRGDGIPPSFTVAESESTSNHIRPRPRCKLPTAAGGPVDRVDESQSCRLDGIRRHAAATVNAALTLNFYRRLTLGICAASHAVNTEIADYN